MKVSECKIKCVYPCRVPRESLANLPLSAYNGKIILVSTNEEASHAVSQLLKEKVLGFDTESRPSFTRDQNYPVSIIQLCGEDCVWLFKLSCLHDSMAKIFAILEQSHIKKVGVAVNGDIAALRKLRDFQPAGFEDISEKTRKIGIVNTGLRNLAAAFLGQRISKGAQMSNWAVDKLTQKQITYAATDAWISRELYLIVSKIYAEHRYELDSETDCIDCSQQQMPNIIVRLFRFLRNRGK